MSVRRSASRAPIGLDQGFFNAPLFLIDPLLEPIRDERVVAAAVERAKKRHFAIAQKFGLDSALGC